MLYNTKIFFERSDNVSYVSPTQQAAKKADPWISGKDEHVGWEKGLEAAEGQGEKETERLNWGSRAVMKSIPSGRETTSLYEKGKRLVTAKWVLIYREAREADGFRCAVHVGKRMGGAVERNRLRRQVREALRGLQLDDLSLELIVIPRMAAKGQKFSEMSGQLKILLQRLRELQRECSLFSVS